MNQPRQRLPLAPIQEVSGCITEDPIIIAMDSEGNVIPFNPQQDHPGKVYSMVGYSEARDEIFQTSSGKMSRILTKPLGNHPLRDHYKVIQGNGNVGFQRFYIFPTGEIKE